MARWDEVPDDVWARIFSILESHLERARCLAVCRDWCRVGRWARPPPRLPSIGIPSSEAGMATLFDVLLRERFLLPSAPSFQGMRAIGSFDSYQIAVEFSVPNPTRYALVDLTNGVVTMSIPDQLRLSGSHELQPVVITAITGGREVLAAVPSGRGLILWRVGMDAWCPPLRAPAVDDEEEVGMLWRMPTPDALIDDILYHAPSDSIYVLTIRSGVYLYQLVRLPEGGVAVELKFSFLGDDPRGTDASRYLCTGPDGMLVVRRFVSTTRGTTLFELCNLHNDGPRRWSCRLLARPPTGMLLFLGRGCSRAYPAAGRTRAFIFFLDDRDGFRSPSETYRQYDNGLSLVGRVIRGGLPMSATSSLLSPLFWAIPPGL